MLLKSINIEPNKINLTNQIFGLRNGEYYICVSLILGSLLFIATNLLKNTILYKKILGIYKPIGLIMYSMKNHEDYFFEQLNKKTRMIFKRDIFVPKTKFVQLSIEDKALFLKLQNRFYSIAYYELQYHSKIEYPKTYQSFYFFFRQLVTACILMLLFSLIILKYVLSVYNAQYQLLIFATVVTGIISVVAAIHFRSEMVKKLYIIYNQHLLNKIENEKPTH